jgi:dephospho-CoA kinase
MGKTTVSDYLMHTYGLPVLDADRYAREAVEPGSLVLDRLVQRYGRDLLLVDGRLDRRRLGEIVFSDAAERRWLEQQIHPDVRDRIETTLHQLATQNQPTAVVVVPLLFEAEMTDLVTEIWVVHTPAAQQRERLQQRDRLSPEQIQARIASQMAIDQKIAQADVVIANDSTLDALYHQIDHALVAPESRR